MVLPFGGMRMATGQGARSRLPSGSGPDLPAATRTDLFVRLAMRQAAADPADFTPGESGNWFSRLRGAVMGELQLEYARGTAFLLLPVSFGAGAIVYFSLGEEPGWAVPVVMALVSFGLRILLRNRFPAALLLSLVTAFLCGLVAGKVETWRYSTALLGANVITRVEGRIITLERLHNGQWRMVLDVVKTERPRLKYPPRRIRVTARDIPAAADIGTGLAGYVNLRAPSGPVRPGNYDFSFHAFFRELSANGFFMGVPKPVAVPAAAGWNNIVSQAIFTLRSTIADRIQSILPGETGQIAAALISGQRAGISEETNEALRLAGLAHILSISGLHLALAAAVVMFSLRFLFALSPGFAARHPVKKYAAMLSLLSCSFYLAISGADVAAQRSYVMIAIMLAAIMLDRAALSMRNLALAALAMIAISPHEILGPSFQMSFSATAALIAAFAWWTARRQRAGLAFADTKQGKAGLGHRLLGNLAATAATSVVAGLASGIFAAYHFHNTAPLGVLGNAVALPVISLLVMPFAVLALLLMPLQLEGLALPVMGFGIELVLAISRFIAEHSPSGNPGRMPMVTLLAWTVAVLIAVICTSRLRLLAVVPMLIGLVAFIASRPPDIVVAEDARLVAVRTGPGQLAVNLLRPNKFTLDNWQLAYRSKTVRAPQFRQAGFDEQAFLCEESLCSIVLANGQTLAYTDDYRAIGAACNIGDIVILAVAGKNLACRQDRSGRKMTISRRELAIRGAIEIWLPSHESGAAKAEQKIAIAHAVGAPARPWNMHRLYSRAARGWPPRETYRQSAGQTGRPRSPIPKRERPNHKGQYPPGQIYEPPND